MDVRLDAGERGRLLHFSVRDTGIGIPLEKQQSIFSAFTQADGSITRKYGGAGLGLAISSRLLALMGGAISVDSRPGQGSRFDFSVPCDVPAAEPGADAPLRNWPADMPRLKVLLAEDNAVNQKLAQKLLEKRGHTVTVVSNGKEAVAAAERVSFDVILMDIQMPEMNGLEATALIRAREAHTTNHVPIIAMTAHAMAGDRERCLASGMDGYVSKPVRLDDLLEQMAAVTLA